MKRKMAFLANFKWRILLLRLLINAFVLLIAALLLPSIYFVDRTLRSLLLLALILGVLNVFVKPVVQFLTFRFIFASYGLIVILINAFMLWLLSFLFPERLAVDKVFWALVGGALIGLLSGLLESLLGVTAPIVGDRYPELRRQVKDTQPFRLQKLVSDPLLGASTAALPSAPDTAALAEAVTPVATGPDEASVQVAAGGEA